MKQMSSEAKASLAKTIRALREKLLEELELAVNREYRLATKKAADAGLSAHLLQRRLRLEAALNERASELGGKEGEKLALKETVKEAAYTLLNKLVLIRHLEALKLSRPAVVTGGWESKGYKEFRQFAAGLCGDESQGYGTLLGLLYDELGMELPGLFGDVGLTALVPIPTATLREVVEALDASTIADVWEDDTTLGWVYQYWNDPEREALDAKLNARGKLEGHELASKTQMFTERYMVEWLLQNTLGATWLAICKKRGWTADAEQVLRSLESRRAEWRKQRERGDVALDALMPIDGGLEEQWKYFVPQPMPHAVVEKAPASIREVRLLDPACGSGHFLVIAFDLFAAMYREEARHLGETWSDREIAERIVEDNLHGVDIDPRAAQVAAAAVYVKSRRFAADAHPQRMNVVAPALRLGSLPKDDPALVTFRKKVREETGISEDVTSELIDVLKGVDHLGTLLRLGSAVDEVIVRAGLLEAEPAQGDLLRLASAREPVGPEQARQAVLKRLDDFLHAHGRGEDLGLRLPGEQLVAGLRFARLMREGSYDVVVGNPPYQGTSRMADKKYVEKQYPRGKADLYAAFLERALELTKEGGVSALLTMRGWMFLTQYTALREHLLATYDLRLIGDVDRGAFEEVPDEVLAAAMAVFRKIAPGELESIALQPTPLSDKSRDKGRTTRKRAALLAQVGRFEFASIGITQIPASPIVYWWPRELMDATRGRPTLGTIAPTRAAQSTGDNARFIRRVWEVSPGRYVRQPRTIDRSLLLREPWQPLVGGRDGADWFEPLRTVVNWRNSGLEIKQLKSAQTGREAFTLASESFFFQLGIAVTKIGTEFAARAHRYVGIFSDAGSSLFPSELANTLCLLNSKQSRFILESFNPTINFQAGDVDRLPMFPVEGAESIYQTLIEAFERHERTRETSIEFVEPGPSCWPETSRLAYRAVNRDDSAPIHAAFESTPSPKATISYAMGCALGRFQSTDCEHQQPSLFLSVAQSSGLPHGIVAVWNLIEVSERERSPTAHDWLRERFFDFHRKLYENRPIYFPLSSAKRSFVVYVNIHRWTDNTLQTILADHLLPERKALAGEIEDLRSARAASEKSTRSEAERRYTQVSKWLEELDLFIAKVREIAEKGPPLPDAKTTPREADAPFKMDLDDGVMINSAALWPLLEPQWNAPKKWWKELANAHGKKDYDWAHLSERYFPSRVDDKCRKDPSLAVAHKRFWRYHPAKAFQWELRLQDEISPDFTLDEPDSDEHRRNFLEKHPDEAERLRLTEQARRDRKAKKEAQEELALESEDDAVPEEDDE